MSREIQGHIGLFDVNGAVLTLKEGQEPHLVTKSITPTFLDSLGETLSKLAYSHLTRLERADTLFHDLFNTSLAIPQLPYEKEFDQFFDRYVLRDETVDGIANLHIENLDMTLISGMPRGTYSRFVTDLKKVIPYLNPNLDVVLNPNNELYSGINTKMSFPGIFPDYNVYCWDDDFVVALWLSHYYNLKVYMPISETAARNQPHLEHLTLPPRGTNGDIRFNATPEVILEDVKNPLFINRPLRRYG
jgi:hypothetical protein